MAFAREHAAVDNPIVEHFDPKTDGTNGTIAVIGLGYIGIPTAVIFALRGWNVIGVDTDKAVVDTVSRLELPFEERGLEAALTEAIRSYKLTAQQTVPHADVFIVSVPTPLRDDKTADLSFVDAATRAIAPMLHPGNSVVFESTLPPGATEKFSRLIIELRNDLSFGASAPDRQIFVAHAPERVLPGRVLVELAAIDRVIGGIDADSGTEVRKIYSTFCTGAIHVTDASTAEMTKLAENSFRDVNIAFANELSMICDELDVDVWNLISLANRHPRVNILRPGPGVGGHCIAVDPWFLANAVENGGKLIAKARQVNVQKQEYTAKKIQEAIDSSASTPPVVWLLGIAFKPDIDDLRESPSLYVAEELIGSRPLVQFRIIEPYIRELPNELGMFDNVRLCSETVPRISSKDLVVLLVGHKVFEPLIYELENHSALLDFCGMTKQSIN